MLTMSNTRNMPESSTFGHTNMKIRTNKAWSQVMLVLLLSVILSGLLAYPVMWLWNTCLVPAITTLYPVTWLQAWGIMFLVRMLAATGLEAKIRD